MFLEKRARDTNVFWEVCYLFFNTSLGSVRILICFGARAHLKKCFRKHVMLESTILSFALSGKLSQIRTHQMEFLGSERVGYRDQKILVFVMDVV